MTWISHDDVAVFRLPATKDILFLRNGPGNDRFMVMPFSTELKELSLKGNFQLTDEDEAGKMLNALNSVQNMPVISSTAQEYKLMVGHAVEAIRNGTLDKVVLSNRFVYPRKSGIGRLFLQLCDAYPDAFVYTFSINGVIMSGATPETLLSQNENELFTEALGGTAGGDEFREKEKEEHQQIVGFIEQILKENSLIYTKENTRSKKAGDLQHLCTPFRIGNTGNGALNLARKLHPTPAVCGVPREKAMQYIADHEAYKRAYYTGYLGPVFGDGSFNLFVNLRCASWYTDGVVLYAGAGINAASDPDEEWEEVCRKKDTLGIWLK